MNKPMRFCMITTFYPPYNFGGDGWSVHRLANALAQQGHHVEVVHCRDAYRLMAGGEPKASYNDHPNVTVHGLKSRLGMLSPLATQQTGFPLLKSARLRRILAQPFDVIHYHNISLVGGPGVFAYGQGIKLCTMHEFWLVCPMHVLYKYNRMLCDGRNCMRCSLAHRRPPQLWRYAGLVQRMSRHVDCFLAPSRFCRDKHIELGFQAKILPFSNFVPIPPPMQSTEAGAIHPLPRRPYFLCVGRLEKIKGFQTVIPLFQKRPDFVLAIAGSGTYEPELRRLAGESQNILFLGYQSGQALYTLYQRALAVLVPSICFEIQGLVVLEAFTQHTPVIVRNLGGMPEMIQDSGAGYVYNTEDELPPLLDKLANDPTHRNELGERGYQAYLRNWTAEVFLERYFQLIEEIGTEKGKKPASYFNVFYN